MIKYRGIIRLSGDKVKQSFAATRPLIMEWARKELERLPAETVCDIFEVQEVEVLRVQLLGDGTFQLAPFERDGKLL